MLAPTQVDTVPSHGPTSPSSLARSLKTALRITPYNWNTGEGEPRPGDLNPRAWTQIDFGKMFRHDGRPVSEKLRARQEAKIEYRKRSFQLSGSALAPICSAVPVAGLPPRIKQLNNLFDVVTSEIGNLPSAAWLEAFGTGLKNGQIESEEWEGRMIWAATEREDFLAFASSFASVGSQLQKLIPSSRYPSRHRAGYRAPFIDVGLGSSIGFSWVLNLDYNVQFSAAISTAVAYWADMASGVDAPAGELAQIFDVMPSLAQACATGEHDNLAPMKSLAIEYLRTETVKALPGPVPSTREVWLSRLADVGARETTVLMTGCPGAWSNRRSAKDTRCLVAWGIMHDFYDLPRDLATGNRVNGVLWALFAGFSARQVLAWLRDTVTIAAGHDSCGAKLLLCTALIHVTNPRWSVNGLALSELYKWPPPPKKREGSEDKLPLFTEQDGDNGSAEAAACSCTGTQASRALGKAALDALNGSADGFASVADRLDAHNTGMSAILAQDWDTQIDLSRTAWSSFLSDLAAIAAWVDMA
ncbi:hypothetical protein FDECE_15599 [Fusarium decemcellulare]|nr:hypothetical protein FDECE_15599 [Fusarium decemcellulare]